MKVALLVLFFPNFIYTFSRSKKPFKEVFEVIGNLTEKTFIENAKTFNIFVYGESSKHLDEIVCAIGSRFVTSVKHITERTVWSGFEDSAIVLTKTLEGFKNFDENMKLINLFPVKFSFIFYIENLRTWQKLDELPKTNLLALDNEMNPMSSSRPLNFGNFIVNSKSEIHVVTFEWFTHKKCD